MCNCGSKRNSYTQQTTNADTGTSNHTTNGSTYFEYTGKTALSVVGNVTGKNYRFHHSGDVQPIDHRDVAGMAMVPVLKRK